ncbi:hypothetical protein [Oceanithermus sp.]|uniref:hypothetical protein n=1 Tax=Oceanithermus sp. TaxID=2268145 RepID=UPI0025E2DEC1|nr:hypothetical protein [Oceanithermus sp.]
MAYAPERWRQRYAEVEAVVATASGPLLEWLQVVERKLVREVVRTLGRDRLLELGVLMRALDPEAQALADSLARELWPVVNEFSKWIRAEAAVKQIPGAKDIVAAALISGGFLPGDPNVAEFRDRVKRLYADGVMNHLMGFANPERLAVWMAEQRGLVSSLQQLEDAIMRRGVSRAYQAERIVRTTYTAGSNMAALARITADGYEYKKWVATKDARVRGRRKRDRHDHLHLDGVTVHVNEAFRDPRSGEMLMFPGDTSLGAGAGAVVNCRCTLVGVDSAGKTRRRPGAKPRPKRQPKKVDFPARRVGADRPFGGVSYDELERAIRELLEDIENRDRWAGRLVEKLDPDPELFEGLRVDASAPVREVAEQATRVMIAAGGRMVRDLLESKPVKFRARKGVRARYSGSQITLDSARPDLATALHELGHWLEDRAPGLLGTAINYRASRTTGGLTTMRALTGDRYYRFNEFGYKTNFPNPYMGKVYKAGGREYGTEVTSMVVEALGGNSTRAAAWTLKVLEDGDLLPWLYRALRRAYADWERSKK